MLASSHGLRRLTLAFCIEVASLCCCTVYLVKISMQRTASMHTRCCASCVIHAVTVRLSCAQCLARVGLALLPHTRILCPGRVGCKERGMGGEGRERASPPPLRSCVYVRLCVCVGVCACACVCTSFVYAGVHHVRGYTCTYRDMCNFGILIRLRTYLQGGV